MALTDQYDAFYKTNKAAGWSDSPPPGQWPRSRVDAIVADAPSGGTVLDVGCGDGQLLFLLRDKYSQLIGHEFSATRLRYAAENLAGLPFRGIQGSAESMPELETDSIDVIVSADTIEHIPDVYRAAAELYRILKPGGAIVINTPNIAYIKRRAQLLMGRFPSTSQGNEGLGSDILFDGGHLHYFTYRSLRLVMERAGFTGFRRRGYGKFGRAHALWPSLTSVGVQLTATKRT